MLYYVNDVIFCRFLKVSFKCCFKKINKNVFCSLKVKGKLSLVTFS